jgi:hypothetical protein
MRPVYVVSEDVHLLLGRWATQRFGRLLELPFEELRRRLCRILAFGEHNVVFVSADTIMRGLDVKLRGEYRHVVSADPVYRLGDLMLHLTRCVDEHLCALPGLYPRHGTPPKEAQYAAIARALNASSTSEVSVVLVDDVVFSGGVVRTIIHDLADRGVRVERVVAGIAVITSTVCDPFTVCQSLGAELEAVVTFGGPGRPCVVDEICERDFCVACPMHGRSFVNLESNVGAPYIAPFGRPADWASFGQHADAVSHDLIELNIWWLEQMEQEIGRPLRFDDLERKPFGVSHPDVADDAVRLHLEAHLHTHEHFLAARVA